MSVQVEVYLPEHPVKAEYDTRGRLTYVLYDRELAREESLTVCMRMIVTDGFVGVVVNQDREFAAVQASTLPEGYLPSVGDLLSVSFSTVGGNTIESIAGEVQDYTVEAVSDERT